jgi:pimeloyl-ACP methyl ester carboxylesterase
LHGFSESGNHAVPQAVKQQALEFGVPEYLIFTPTMPNSAACIESSADWFAGVVNAVLVQTGAAQVDIVAHSLGGIVARTYMKRHNAFRHVRNLVTVASPNHGMRAAALLALICSSRQVMMGSSFLRSLNTTETPDPTFYSTVVGNRDPVVSPFESAGLSGARNEVVNGAGDRRGGRARARGSA